MPKSFENPSGLLTARSSIWKSASTVFRGISCLTKLYERASIALNTLGLTVGIDLSAPKARNTQSKFGVCIAFTRTLLPSFIAITFSRARSPASMSDFCHSRKKMLEILPSPSSNASSISESIPLIFSSDALYPIKIKGCSIKNVNNLALRYFFSSRRNYNLP